MPAKPLFFSLAAAWILAGCSMAPELEITPPELPEASTNRAENNETSAIDARWWEGFNDARLNTLVGEALSHNDDLKIAASRVALARASLGFSRAERYPTIDASASANRQKTSGESLSPFSGIIYNNFAFSASASYEFDFWGKYRNLELAAREELIATEADRETVRISLVGSVTELYFTLVSQQRSIAVTAEAVDAYKASYDYRKRQFEHGVIDALTLEQSRALYAGAKVSLTTLKESRILTENALGILLGRTPKALLASKVGTAGELPEPLQIPSGLTSGLLEHRPDIRAAEARLRSANAAIGVAKAAYFPNISLTGNAGYSSTEFDRLMTSGAQMWGFGPALYVPLLDFGRIRSNVEKAEAEKEAAVTTYAQTVRNAFREVYDALAKIGATREKLAAQQEADAALERVLLLTESRFERGYGTYLEVVEAKRELLASRTNVITLNTDLITNQVTLYKALGGGWKPVPDAE